MEFSLGAHGDVEDLKVPVRLTVIWVESVLLIEQYEEDMPGG